MTYKTFISAVMAAAVALTALSSAPARADNDTAKIIAGAAALAVIGIAIAEAADDDDRYATRRGHYERQYRLNRYNRHYPHTYNRFNRYDRYNRHARNKYRYGRQDHHSYWGHHHWHDHDKDRGRRRSR